MNKRLRDKEAWIVTAKREQAHEKEHPELIEGKVAELKEIRKQKDMSRAEEAALKAYPEWPRYNDLAQKYQDINGEYRVGFEVGYEQAEKDLVEKAVTWWSNNLVESEPTKGHYISAFKEYMENK